ncbi:phage tail tape measure protein [Escherichia coli]|nr:phage tail tape measure protein [Escherichia coli]
MATLRELIIKISANSQSFQSEIQRASRMGSEYYRTLQNGGRQAAAAAREQRRALAELNSQLTEIRASAVGMTSAFAGAFATGHLISLADEWSSVNARLKQASQSSDEFALSQKVLMDISQRTGTAFSDNATLFARSAASMREYGYSADDVLKVTEAISTGLKISGASAAEAGSVITQFSQALAQNAQYLSERLKDQEAFYAESDAQRADWQKGLQEGLSNWVDSASDYASQAAQLATDGISGMVNNITEMLNGNKVEWRSWAASILQEISKVLMNAAIVNGIKMAANSMSGAGGFFGSIGNWLGGAVANAKGGVYTSANLSAYSNSIVDTPTYFAFAKGAGLMGEAGPEAIMPLTRAADGSLGVRAVGSMNGSAGLVYSPVYHIAIQNDGANGQIGPEAAGTLVQLIDQRVQAVMLSMRRDGGMLSG